MPFHLATPLYRANRNCTGDAFAQPLLQPAAYQRKKAIMTAGPSGIRTRICARHRTVLTIAPPCPYSPPCLKGAVGVSRLGDLLP